MRSLSKYNSELKSAGFNAFQIESDGADTRIYSRKDFYKICLTTGSSKIHYADRSFQTDGTILFFGNPHVPYSWETLSADYVGYTCLFSEDFFAQSSHPKSLQHSPLFKFDGTPILQIDTKQREFLNGIFLKMIEEQQSDYAHKDDLLRSYIDLILHEALKLQPSQQLPETKNSAARLTAVFMDLLDRQFPIEDQHQPLQLRSAKDYAERLFVHVNSLNRAVKKITGKPTSVHIAESIVREAKAMLKHSNWNVAEIAYALGFEYPTYFNKFFKKHTSKNPSALRS